jgi:ABC-2 type transport system ATP-binding protein
VAPAIQCRDLRKTYNGKVEAVRGLNLGLQTGECFGLLGPNGAGKTTTIEILEGLLVPLPETCRFWVAVGMTMKSQHY